MFKFKRFEVSDEHCAMKVGTDGVLLGAWADISAATRVLDVGTGCGLIALMLAQRFPLAKIEALEIDEIAAKEAADNVAKSPFAAQVEIKVTDFACFRNVSSAECALNSRDNQEDLDRQHLEDTSQGYVALYDAVVSNPPFFEEELLPPDSQRASARHTSAGLTFERLISHSAELLREGGTLQVIIPKTAQNRFHAICSRYNFMLLRSTDVRTVLRKEPKRVLLHFVKSSGEVIETTKRDELVLMENGERTEQYAALCRDFYL